MSPPRPRAKDLPEKRRECILKAARCVFARQGYADTVVDDIASQAGIAKGTLYLYFKSKQDVFFAALLEDARQLDQDTRERMLHEGTWEGKIGAYIDVRLDYLEQHEDFLRIYLSEIRSMMVYGIKMQSELFHVLRDSEDHLAQIFAAAIAKREIREVDPEMAAITLSDVMRGLMERRLLGWSRMNNRTEAMFVLDLLRTALALPAKP